MLRHGWRVPEAEYARHEARRGSRFAYQNLAPERTALVVVDMVDCFVTANPYCAGIVAPIEELAGKVREVGGTVVWVVPESGPNAWVRAEFFGTAVAERYRAAALEARPWRAFTIAESDLHVTKSAASAFFPGRCELSEELRTRGIDTVLIAGTVANVCCESSARDASTLGYRVIMVADANAAGSDDELNASLRTVYRSFGDVRPSVELFELLSR